MKKAIIGLLIALIFISLVGCSDSKNSLKEESRDLFAMDTYMTLKVCSESPKKVLDKAENEIKRLDKMFSVGNKNSEVCIVNENGSIILSKESDYLYNKSKIINSLTSGAFDITVFPIMKEWGFVNQKYKVPDDETIKKLLKNVGMNKLEYNKNTRMLSLEEGTQIDFGGIAKGYTSQRIMEIFKRHDVKGGIVSLGGNVEAYGEKKDGSCYKVGIENPFGERDYVGILEVQNKAVITSGGYERFFEYKGKTYHHIINPKTGRPSQADLASVTVVCKDGTLGDGLSTALFVMGKEKALKFWKKHHAKEEFDVILVENNKKITISEGLKKDFSSKQKFDVYK